MANDNQFRNRTRIVATRGVAEYRASIPHLVRPDDVVLELGCEWGTTTTGLASACATVIGTDVSPKCIDRARVSHPGIRFEVLDAFDVRSALALETPFTAVYMDLSGFSGYRSLLDVIALTELYATVFELRLLVVKSGALKSYATRCLPWNPDQAERSRF